MVQEESGATSLLVAPNIGLYVIISVSALVVYVPIVIGHGSSELQNDGKDLLQDEQFKSLMRITMLLCCPIIASIWLDYLFSPDLSASWKLSIQTYRMWTGLVFLLPSAGIYAFCIDPPFPALMQVIYMTQFILIMYPTLLVLNRYDGEIWTNTKSYSILVLHTLSRICWAVYYSASLDAASYAGAGCRVVAACIGVPCVFVWVCKHRDIILSVVMTRNTFYEYLSHERKLAILHVSFILVLALASPADGIGDAYSVANGRTRGITQLSGLALLVLLPGRLARRDAEQSDVRLASNDLQIEIKAVVLCISLLVIGYWLLVISSVFLLDALHCSITWRIRRRL